MRVIKLYTRTLSVNLNCPTCKLGDPTIYSLIAFIVQSVKKQRLQQFNANLTALLNWPMLLPNDSSIAASGTDDGMRYGKSWVRICFGHSIFLVDNILCKGVFNSYTEI